MKKCAILLSGIINNTNYENIKENIINSNPNYEFDFFLSFWDYFFGICYSESTELNDILVNPKLIDVEKILGIYNPKKFVNCNVSEFIHFYNTNKLNDIMLKNNYYQKYKHLSYRSLSQFYMVNQVINILSEYENDNNLHYDVVIRYRYDLFTTKPIYLDNFNYENEIYGIQRKDCFPDWIFISNSTNMKLFMKAYLSILNGEINSGSPEEIFIESCVKNVKNCNMSFTLEDTFELIR
jgi:hypothetical protein